MNDISFRHDPEIVTPEVAERIAITAGEFWAHYGAEDPDEIMSALQRQAIGQAVAAYREHTGDDEDEDEDGYDPEDERYESPEGQLAQAVAMALNTASALRAAGADIESVRAYAMLIAAMMGDKGAAQREAILMVILAEDTAEVPLAQAARDAMMPFACSACGVEVDTPEQQPEHLENCPLAPDAVADAKRRLFDRIVALVPAGRRRDEIEWHLADLVDLAEGGLDEDTRAELVNQVLDGRPSTGQPHVYDVAPGEPVAMRALSPEHAVALAVRERDRAERDYGKYADDDDPNPRWYAREARQQGAWEPVYLDRLPELPPDPDDEEYDDEVFSEGHDTLREQTGEGA